MATLKERAAVPKVYQVLSLTSGDEVRDVGDEWIQR